MTFFGCLMLTFRYVMYSSQDCLERDDGEAGNNDPLRVDSKTTKTPHAEDTEDDEDGIDNDEDSFSGDEDSLSSRQSDSESEPTESIGERFSHPVQHDYFHVDLTAIEYDKTAWA